MSGRAEAPAAPAAASVVLLGVVGVLGWQAWRCAVELWAGGELSGWLCGLPFLALPLLRRLAVVGGCLRSAALCAAALALLRLLSPLGGATGLVLYGLLGSGLYAACLDVYLAGDQPPRQTLQALLLGWVLAVGDRLVTSTADLQALGGHGSWLVSALLTLPALGLAVVVLRGPAGAAPRQVPSAVGVPLAVIGVQLGLAHPSRTASLTAWLPWPLLGGLVLLAATATAAGLGYDALLRGLLRRRSGARLSRSWFAAGGLLLTGPLVFGWLVPQYLAWGLPAGALLAAGCLTVLLRARPIGRPRQVGEWSAVPAWWLAVGLSGLAVHDLWPALLALLALELFAVVAAWHPLRAATERAEPLCWPPVLLTALVLLLGVARVLQAWLAPWDLAGEVYERGVRVVAVDLRGSAPNREALPRWAAQLQQLDPAILIVRGTRERSATGFCDAGLYLADRLGLTVAARYPGAEVLARARPAVAYHLNDQLGVTIWWFGDRGFGLAAALEEPLTGAELAAAAGLLAGLSHRVVLADLGSTTGSPLAGYRRVEEVVCTRPGLALLVSPETQPVSVAPAPALDVPGLTALLVPRP
ncbi:MAG: hypothetical protein IT204_21245 [Fimbriimonadaceae bacterium]|nr:hypothetical protein [Fimbriimonadaceae bacterium]